MVIYKFFPNASDVKNVEKSLVYCFELFSKLAFVWFRLLQGQKPSASNFWIGQGFVQLLSNRNIYPQLHSADSLSKIWVEFWPAALIL